jgi:acetylornithine deacetylase/succinyl-diaminopimelate desuccinylase-like protein
MNQPEVVELLQHLIAVPSVNPEHSDDSDIADEFRMAECVGALLAAKGFSLSWDRMSDRRLSVIGSYGPEHPVRTLLLEAHLDTVGVANMRIPPFTPRVEGGRVYGRGACDTKGPMAATLTALTPDALASLAAAGWRVLFVGALGEEKGNLGAGRLVEQGLGADWALILEPTGCDVVFAHKGVVWLEITLEGESGHGSDPSGGRNAIAAMSDLLVWLREQATQDQVSWRHTALGSPTLNVGRIRGGEAVNIVAQTCVCELDYRVVPGMDGDGLVSRVREHLAMLQAKDVIRAFDVKVMKNGDAFETSTDAALVKSLQAVVEGDGGGADLCTVAWHSDASFFSRTCAEVVVFGPGHIRQAHTADEYIEIHQLEKAVRIFEKWFRQLGRQA